mgnify:CR=1 FL=1
MKKDFWLSALKRAGWTAAQTALGMLTLGVGIQDVDWLGVLSVSALAAVYSLLKSIVVGMPEVSDDADL